MLRSKANKLEKKIANKEMDKGKLVQFLQTSYDEDKAKAFHELEQEIDALTAQWMEAVEELESFLKEQ